MDGHRSAAAFAALEAALAHSPSSALTYNVCVSSGWAGQAERAISGRAGDAPKPVDPWASSAYHARTLGIFAAVATGGHHNRSQSDPCDPGHSTSYMLLAASLAKLGRVDEAKAARAVFWNCSPRFATVGNLPVWTASLRSPLL